MRPDRIEIEEDRVLPQLQSPRASSKAYSDDNGGSSTDTSRGLHKSDGETTLMSDSSDGFIENFGSQRAHATLQIKCTNATAALTREQIATNAQRVAFGVNQMHSVLNAELSEEERRKGFRLSAAIDETYLGFAPSRRDKRPYLKAMALVHADPGSSMMCALPVSRGQYLSVFGLFLFLAAIVIGAVFYVRSVEQEKLR